MMHSQFTGYKTTLNTIYTQLNRIVQNFKQLKTWLMIYALLKRVTHTILKRVTHGLHSIKARYTHSIKARDTRLTLD